MFLCFVRGRLHRATLTQIAFPSFEPRHHGEGTTHFARWDMGPWYADRSIVDLTAEKRHSLQQTCPHGVTVGYVGGERQMGQT